MATTNYMKRITFIDGQVLHDFHLNIMQKNISEAIKTKTTQEKYDMMMLVSPYNYYFMEPFIDESQKDTSSTAQVDQQTFSISSGQWITKLIELPMATDEIYLQSTFEDYPENNAFVNFYYRTSTFDPWVKVNVDTPIYMTQISKYVQIKIECAYNATVRPVVYDFALMSK